jgi:hypothetical protein
MILTLLQSDLASTAMIELLEGGADGRDEDNIAPGEWWWRRHDEYGNGRG